MQRIRIKKIYPTSSLQNTSYKIQNSDRKTSNQNFSQKQFQRREYKNINTTTLLSQNTKQQTNDFLRKDFNYE